VGRGTATRLFVAIRIVVKAYQRDRRERRGERIQPQGALVGHLRPFDVEEVLAEDTVHAVEGACCRWSS
jgi:hypothetical protein